MAAVAVDDEPNVAQVVEQPIATEQEAAKQGDALAAGNVEQKQVEQDNQTQDWI